MHSHFEKEFLHKNEETAQLLQRQQEMLEHFREESTAKAELELELHTAEGECHTMQQGCVALLW
jgi:hypothetical protein